MDATLGRVTVGQFFATTRYSPQPLPLFADLRDALPSPIYDSRPDWIATYWTAWRIAFDNFRRPTPGSGFVSNYIDAAFSDNVYLWDSVFMTMFCNVAAPLVPGIQTMDNFYARQQPDGEICREIDRATGEAWAPWLNVENAPLASRAGWTARDFEAFLEVAIAGGIPALKPVHYRGREAPASTPYFTLDCLDNPIAAWAEWESYRVTGDRDRLRLVWEPLVRYYRALQTYLPQGNGLYVTDSCSMDNSPRNDFLDGGGTGVDISSQMVLFARQLALIGRELGLDEDAAGYDREASELAAVINAEMWDDVRGCYVDLTLEGEQVSTRTVGMFWTLLAGVAPPDRAARLVDLLLDPATFGRPNAVPTVAADEALYNPTGGYWRGSVWAPTTTMVVRGLQYSGHDELARRFAIQHVDLISDVHAATGTIWENYSPETTAPGSLSKPDFVGWSGVGPILFLLEFGIGLRPDAPRNELTWHVTPGVRHGCRDYRFNGHVVTLVATPEGDGMRVNVDSSDAFTLVIGDSRLSVVAGPQAFFL